MMRWKTHVKCRNGGVDVVDVVTGIKDQNAVAGNGKTGCEWPATSPRSHDDIVILGSVVRRTGGRSSLVLAAVEVLVGMLMPCRCVRAILATFRYRLTLQQQQLQRTRQPRGSRRS